MNATFFVEYEQRNMVLSRMGFNTYADYLNSSLWRAIRNRALKQAKGKCALCGEDASEVHHTSYSEDVMRGKDQSGVTCLCHTCHDLAEFDGERKTNQGEANNRLLLFSTGRKTPPKAPPSLPPNRNISTQVPSNLPPDKMWQHKRYCRIIAKAYGISRLEVKYMPKRVRMEMMLKIRAQRN
jgi:hypothetical protein